MKQINNKITLSSFAALFCAMVTIFILAFHLPSGAGGYIHLADGIIYLAAAILPMPYAVFAASVGGGLADFLSGYPVYIIPTFLIKAMLVPLFSSKNREKILTKRNLVAIFLAFFVTVGGYAITDFVLSFYLYGYTFEASFASMLTTLSGNTIQAAASAVIFVLVGSVFDKSNIKAKLPIYSK
ncbi:MAG: TIGR04002 family protein [Clostridia bacterium]